MSLSSAASLPAPRRSLATVVTIAAIAALPAVVFTAGVVVEGSQGNASLGQTVTPVKDGRAVQHHTP
jgi:hypothetical protein